MIAEATGCRLGSLRGLRWADWEFDRPAIRWKSEFDKRKQERTVPIPRALAERVKALRLTLEAFGDGWLFPDETGNAPWPRELFDQALRRAERKAGLPKLDGSLWHAYRRKWATERKHLSVRDVREAGGWKDVATLQTCYQQADEATVIAVMECPNKLMDLKISANG